VLRLLQCPLLLTLLVLLGSGIQQTKEAPQQLLLLLQGLLLLLPQVQQMYLQG
jgi:hypothetical protein